MKAFIEGTGSWLDGKVVDIDADHDGGPVKLDLGHGLVMWVMPTDRVHWVGNVPVVIHVGHFPVPVHEEP